MKIFLNFWNCKLLSSVVVVVGHLYLQANAGTGKTTTIQPHGQREEQVRFLLLVLWAKLKELIATIKIKFLKIVDWLVIKHSSFSHILLSISTLYIIYIFHFLNYLSTLCKTFVFNALLWYEIFFHNYLLNLYKKKKNHI